MEATGLDSLTDAQRAVVRLAADHGNKEIAARLGVSENTVKTHLATAKLRLGGMDRRAASRALRASEGAHPTGVSTTGVMPPDMPQQPWPVTVHEMPTPFDGFAPVPREPIIGRRFDALTSSIRLRLMATATLKLAVALLIMLAVADKIERYAVSYFRAPAHH